MAKAKSLCTHCDAKITAADPFCPKCTQPTAFISAEQRTAWELEQWAKKRTTAAPKAGSHLTPSIGNAAPSGLAKRESVSASISVKEPARVRQKPTVHPAIAARAARRAAASSEHVDDKHSAGEKRVIVLSDVQTPPADGMLARKPAQKKLAETHGSAARKKKDVVRRDAVPAKAPERKSEPAAKKTQPQTEPARKQATTPAAKRQAKSVAARSPKSALVPVSVSAAASNTHETNGHRSNGHHRNGHGTNGTSPISDGNGYGMNAGSVLKEAIAEQNEILRELLRRVSAIEEKMPVSAPRARGFRWFKR